MIPADVDIPALARQLEDAPVAFTSPEMVDPVLAEQLSDVVAGESAAVLVAGPGRPAHMRDVGQAVLDNTDFSTVIVRGPGTGAVVSEEHSRATIETSQSNLLAEPDYVVGVAEFLAGAHSFSVSWVAVSTVIVICAVVAGLCVWRSARGQAHMLE
jgi:hypothetical protein